MFTAFSQQPQAGTTMKYNPPQGQDTISKNGMTQNITTKLQCITAMKEYEGKSLEELRLEDYAAGRKGKQAGATPGFQGFGASSAAATQPTGFAFGPSGFGTSTGFGTTTYTGVGLFGQQTPQAASTGGGLFGQANKPLFGATTTAQSEFGGFGTNTSMYGQHQENKTLFGATPTAQPSLFGTGTSTFGQTPATGTGFGGFGTSQAGGLFANKPWFGAQATSTTGFGGFSSFNSGSNLFDKPFSAANTGFGFNPATTSFGFGGTKPTGFGQATTAIPSFNFAAGNTAGTSMFSSELNKPGTLGTFGTSSTTGFGGFIAANTGLGVAPSLGGTLNQTGANEAAQVQQTLITLSDSLFGDSPLFWNLKDSKTFAVGNTAETSMFGSALNKPGTLGPFGTSSTTGFGGFNAANTGLGVAPSLGGTLNQTGANEAAQVQPTQIALSESMYGDSPLFWNLKDNKIKREDVLKPTNPDAQKALLANQHQVSPRPMAKIRSKALSGALNCCKNMTLPPMWLWVLLLVLLLCTFTRGEDIVKVTDNAPSIEGTSHTLTCEMRRRDSVVKWLNGKDDIPIVYSYKNSCHLNPAYERKYNQSCDPSKNIFNLTILNVNEDDNKNKFVCSDGTNSGCMIIILGEYEQRLDDTEDGIITAVSACSSNRNVTFKWLKIDHDGEEIEFNPIILNKSETFCLNDCGNSRHMKYTENISVASSGHGKKYHLKVAVFYGAERIVSNKTRFPYMIEEQAADTKYEDSSVSAVAVIAAAVVFAVVIAAVVVVIFCRKQVIRFFDTFFKRAEIPIEEGSESWEERPLNSEDALLVCRNPRQKQKRM